MTGFLIVIATLLVGAALGVAFDRIYRKIERRWYLRELGRVIPLSDHNQLSEIFVRPSLEIMAGGRGGTSKRAYTHAGDVIALQHLGTVLNKTPVRLRFRYDENAGDPTADWIILGLSRKYSQITDATFEKIFKNSGISVVKIAGTHQYYKTQDGQEFRCDHIPDAEFGSKVQKDFGLIVRLVGDGGNQLLVCGGIHMFGTQGALEVALSPPFIQRVKEHGAREFVQIVEVPVLEDGISINREGLRWRELPFAKMG